MRDEEVEIYNNNLELYSTIVRSKIKARDLVEECLRVFEYFEDYEKCEDLIRILREMDEEKMD
jgi:hypothetical protein